MKRALVAVAAVAATALGLAGCETATPYQPLAAQHGDDRGGYSEQQIEANRFRVEFKGNSLTSRQTVDRYLLFRAAQLTVNNGFDWFQSVDRHTDKQTSYYGDPEFGGWGPDWGLYRPGFGWGYGFGGFGPYGGFGYGPWGGPFDIDQVTRYQASVEIVMGHGQKPNSPHAYDAHQVIQHLQTSIKYPKTS
jgi:hypothetical protein